MTKTLGAFGEEPGTSVIIQREGVRFNPKLSPEDSDKLDRLTHSLKTLIVEFVSESGIPIRPSQSVNGWKDSAKHGRSTMLVNGRVWTPQRRRRSCLWIHS